MTTPAPSPTILWRRPRVIGALLLTALVAAAFANTAFVDTSNVEAPADTAVEYVDLNYDTVVLPAIVETEHSLDMLIAALVEDAEAAGEEYGRREDATKPWSFAVDATGVVTDGLFGEVGLDVGGLPGGITVGVAIPPLGSNTAIRDTGTNLTFNDFTNQTEFQRVAIELNNRVTETVFATYDLPAMVGTEVRVVGAFTWVSKTGGVIDHVKIVPVQIEVVR
jgi:predicted lipoprotein